MDHCVFKLKIIGVIMLINNNESLLIAIENLKSRGKLHHQNLKKNYKLINDIYSPIYQINKILPKPISVGFRINEVMDEVIIDGARSLTKLVKYKESDSLIKNSTNNLLNNTIKLLLNKNKLKIKVYTLAILKNIFS